MLGSYEGKTLMSSGGSLGAGASPGFRPTSEEELKRAAEEEEDRARRVDDDEEAVRLALRARRERSASMAGVLRVVWGELAGKTSYIDYWKSWTMLYFTWNTVRV